MASPSLTFQEHYRKNVVPALQKELGLKNVNAVPKVTKVIINVGLGSFIASKKDYSIVLEDLAAITGQKPVVTKARKAISNFKIKDNQPVGITVTVRGKLMNNFLNKLVNVTFPRIRDFRGISPKSFDGQGNYSVGIKENTVFPEINPDSVEKIYGLEITIVTTAKDNEAGYRLLKALGFPFQEIKVGKAKKKK